MKQEPAPSQLPELAFKDAKAFAAWLSKHHATSQGLWIRFYKKATGIPSLTYAEALDEALCHGWIDGQVKSKDAQSWIHRFVPRKPRSLWSKRNREHFERLTKAGRMKPAGLAQVQAAKADGRWEAAYDPPSTATAHPEFLKRLQKLPKALAFYATLSKSNLYAIHYRLQTAKKPETLERRIAAILAMLERGEKFH